MDYSKIPIEKNVPIEGRNRGLTAFLRRLEVGDSAFIPANGKSPGKIVANIGSFCKVERLRGKTVRIVCRQRTENDIEGVRVWRIE